MDVWPASRATLTLLVPSIVTLRVKMLGPDLVNEVPLRDEKTVRGRIERKPERNWDMIVIAMALPIYT
jgi:hypothetical protein